MGWLNEMKKANCLNTILANYEGFDNKSSELEECIINGSMSWMGPTEYQQCLDRSEQEFL